MKSSHHLAGSSQSHQRSKEVSNQQNDSFSSSIPEKHDKESGTSVPPQSHEEDKNSKSFLEEIRVILQQQIPRYIDQYMEKFHSTTHVQNQTQVQSQPSVYQDSFIPQNNPVYLPHPSPAPPMIPHLFNQC